MKQKNPIPYTLYPIPYQRGFTLIELLVVVSMIAILTTVVAVNFQQMRASEELNGARQELISKIREIQGFAHTGRIVPGQSEPAGAYEFSFPPASATYTIMFEIEGVGLLVLENPRYSEFGSDVILAQAVLDGIPFFGSARITAPYGNILFNGSSYGILELQLQHVKTGDTKTVVMDGISGRITSQ